MKQLTIGQARQWIMVGQVIQLGLGVSQFLIGLGQFLSGAAQAFFEGFPHGDVANHAHQQHISLGITVQRSLCGNGVGLTKQVRQRFFIFLFLLLRQDLLIRLIEGICLPLRENVVYRFSN